MEEILEKKNYKMGQIVLSIIMFINGMPLIEPFSSRNKIKYKKIYKKKLNKNAFEYEQKLKERVKLQILKT